MTPLMQADDLAHAFNTVRERQYWNASTGGSRNLPTVLFKSRSAMVELTYYTQSNTFAVTFSKVTCSFGDFTSSAYKAMVAVLTTLKAAGYPVEAPVEGDEGVLRIEFDPRTKVAYCSLAKLDDPWQDYIVKLARNLEGEITLPRLEFGGDESPWPSQLTFDGEQEPADLPEDENIEIYDPAS